MINQKIKFSSLGDEQNNIILKRYLQHRVEKYQNTLKRHPRLPAGNIGRLLIQSKYIKCLN